MPSGLDIVTAQANAAFCQAANTVEHMLSQALQLDAAHPKHITIAQDMARALHYVFSHYSLETMSVLPMVLSAGAELQEHLDPSFSKVVSMPVWTNVRPYDPHCKNSPLYPLTIGYGQPATPATYATDPSATPAANPSATPAAGPSAKARGKQKAAPDEEPKEDCGHRLECGKCSHPHAMSTSAAPKAKRTCAKSKSKAIITSDDDLELDSAAAVAPQSTPAPAKSLKGVLKRTRESIPNPVSEKGPSYLETDELKEEPMIVGPAPRMGTPYVEIPPAPKFSAKAAGPANGLQEDLKANSTSLVWLQHQPGAAGGVCPVPPHQTQVRGKGSATPTKSRKPAARSRSRRRASTVNVTVNSDDEAGSTGNVAVTTTATTTTAIPATTTAVTHQTCLYYGIPHFYGISHSMTFIHLSPHSHASNSLPSSPTTLSDNLSISQTMPNCTNMSKTASLFILSSSPYHFQSSSAAYICRTIQTIIHSHLAVGNILTAALQRPILRSTSKAQLSGRQYSHSQSSPTKPAQTRRFPALSKPRTCRTTLGDHRRSSGLARIPSETCPSYVLSIPSDPTGV
ncbi:hypothetical protein EDB19DRAFT_1914534 [Suillus lakei]|nr:hypothetical protein EDB19DRAFT_1914534 [Suillus lakei]